MTISLAAGDFDRSQELRRFELDSFEEAVAANRFPLISSDQPSTRALIYLLDGLEWSGNVSLLAQNLPHFPEEFGVDELRNVLARLGFGSMESPLHTAGISGIDLPSLLIAPNEDLFVATRINGDVRVIEVLTGRPVTSRVSSGTRAISFFRRNGNQAKQTSVTELLRRMRPVIAQLFAATLALNLTLLVLSFGVMAIYDLVIPTKAMDTLTAIGLGIAVALVFELQVRGIRARLLGHLHGRLEYLVDSAIYAKLLRLPYAMIADSPVGSQIDRLKQFQLLPQALAGPVAAFLLELPFALMFIGFLMIFAFPIGLIPLVLMVVYGLLAAAALPTIKRLNREAQSTQSEYQAIVFDAISNLSYIKAVGVEQAWRQKLSTISQFNARAKRKAIHAQRVLMTISAAGTPLAGGSTAILGAHLAIQGQISLGVLVASMIVVWRVLSPIQSGFIALTRFAEMRQSMRQIDALLATKDEGTEDHRPITFEFSGHVRLLRASYRYSSGIEFAIKNVDIAIPAKSLIAITGPSGSGKSTLLRLMIGLHAPQSGAVLLNGINISQLPPAELRSAASYVPQSPILVHGTIAQNLRLGRLQATDAEIRMVCEELGLWDSISNLPSGLDTRLDSHLQAVMPGGFCRSISTAQALLAGRKILLLDEPARALDPDLDRALIMALRARSRDLTIVMTTHRPSHARQSDIEIKLQGGEIAAVNKNV